MRPLAYQYYLENGTFVGISLADLGIGIGAIPSSCTTTNYFYYNFQSTSANQVVLLAYRCGTGGKTPQWTGNSYVIEQYVYASNPDYIFTYDYATTNSCNGFCVPPF